ncbi:MAG: aldolase/citrate lyase family protein [Candidatus Omnitrophica bacterium]|nr:aldolase/citrate lyase family protein [Candidatus Omnitrophota bacterium]
MVDLKKKLGRNEYSVGSWITIGDTAVAEIMARAGFDWLVVDMEHSAMTLPEAQELIRTIELSGVVPLVRVGENDPCLIKRVMDAGAHGVVVPMVNTRFDAEAAVKAVNYPPKGTRGVGLARAQGYGFGFERYKKWLREKSIVIAQVEHIESVDNLEEILAVDGIDGSIIGPYDLSGSLGYPGRFDRPEVKKAIKRYEDVCRKMKKPMGFHVVEPDIKRAKELKQKGYKFLAVGLDSLYLGRKCLEVTGELR